ncbi:MAG: Ku protein [Acidobacteriota bacterium]|nr:Ku protein [Acidobacteriota bacterium]
MLQSAVMSARAIASATVSFGLVSIPVKVYASGDSGSAIRFNLLHKKDGSRLKQQYYCLKDGEKVERTEMAKGYEFAKGQYVMFTAEELKALEAQSTQTIEITEFVPTDKVQPVFLDKSYYLGPDKGGDRAYKLLSQALVKTKRSALAKYAARGKMYLVLVRPYDKGLIMQQLRYADEVRAFSDVPLGDSEVKASELKLALQIVEQAVSDKFQPENYEDEVKKRVETLIQKKIDGQEITAEPTEEPKAQVIDLMEALKASLAKDKRKPARRSGVAVAKKVAKKSARKKKASKG